MMYARVYYPVERAPRRELETAGTVRRGGHPETVTIDSLSASGFHVVDAAAVDLDEIVTVGIPGIGAHKAQIVRRSETGYACVFVEPIDEDEVACAGAMTVVWQEFSPDQPSGPAPAQARLSPRGKAVLIVATSAMLWTAARLGLALLIG